MDVGAVLIVSVLKTFLKSINFQPLFNTNLSGSINIKCDELFQRFQFFRGILKQVLIPFPFTCKYLFTRKLRHSIIVNIQRSWHIY